MSYQNRNGDENLINHNFNAPPPAIDVPCDYGNPTNHLNYEMSSQDRFMFNGASKPSGRIYEIFYKNIGLIPNYSGHIPGRRFRYGTTFGNDTINVKRVFD